MFLSSFALRHPWAQVNSRCLKRQIILTLDTTFQFSLSPCPMLEAMWLKNAEHLKQDNLFLILLLLPTSARRVRKIFNLYIQRWRSFTLILVSLSVSLTYLLVHVSPSCTADSKALHLERSHTKAILKGLTMYIHYQRDYWLKHDRAPQSKKLLHYFKKSS